MRKILLLIIFSAFSLCVYAQVCKNPYRVVIMGSSTAEGYGATFKKGWAQLYFDEYLKGLNPTSELINIAKYGYTTYHLSPDGFVPPAGRPLPDPAYNITKALSYKPDVIIINLGSNDPANNIPLAEQQDNYKRIVGLAHAQGVQVWVTTTQPRRGLNTTQVQLLTGIRDWILTYFGDKSINFWNGIATPKDSLLQQYDSGDGVHLNNDGHRLLYNRVVAAGVIETLCKEEIGLAAFTVKPVEDKLQLDWSTSKEKNMAQFIIERSTDSLNWKELDQVAAVGNAVTTSIYTYKDAEILSQPVYYRLNMEAQNGNHSYSKGVKGIPDTLYTKPFRLASFKVTAQEDKLLLDWSTSIEKNMLQFIIERSADSLNWKKLGQVAAVGNATQTSVYKFTDNEIQTKAVYYRLNIEGQNGLHHYSDGVKGIPDTLYTIPFRLSSFNVTPKQSKLELQWATRAEKDMKEYSVERSLDKLVWVKVGTVPAAGTSTVNKTYSFADDIPKAIYVYYRLNMSDKQGRNFYSDTLRASGLITGIPNVPTDASAVHITPNPVNSQFRIDQLSGYVHQVKIYNQSGALVYVKQDYQKGSSINVSTLPAGLYMVVVDDGKYRLKLIKM